MREITPELALVDPELAAAARARLPPPGDCLAPSARLQLAPGIPNADDRRTRPARRYLGLLASAAASLVICAVLASPLLAFLPPRQQPTIDEQPGFPALPLVRPSSARLPVQTSTTPNVPNEIHPTADLRPPANP